MRHRLNYLKDLMRRNPMIFNPIWSLAFPLIHRRNERYFGNEYIDRYKAFETIYKENRWGSAESRSGCGSSLIYTNPLRKSLGRHLRRLDVKMFLDAPCGDFNWMQHVELPDGTRYLGGDIVPDLIESLQKKYARGRYSFRLIDIVNEPIPPADLWLCRDVLFHLPNADVVQVLRNFVNSAVSYLLTTTYEFPPHNTDVRPGGFRFINLRISPFWLPRPLAKLTDFVAPEPPRYLGLWSREQVALALTHQ